ncbi:hypothetical protein LRD18_02500 [Halorhodospira halochloris]|uniref:hypothetical protein n=1 Tax=Halorhodospira halochloris TaxID=1052 RepID=UPI001EE7ED61|nr:hypothetical protein [Halorhodospira halochloris]MCG5529745.1 hypothetical protein [Halorhodospira halochloris]
MNILRPTQVGVLIAGDAVHVAADQRGVYSYTAQPITEDGAAGRRNAFKLACQRLGISRAKVALALPEAYVKRHAIAIPRHRNRRERTALIRLLIRRKLPAPASAWRYRLTKQHGSSARFVATNQTSLRAANNLTAGTDFKLYALIPSRDALRACRGRLPVAGNYPRTPAAKLSAALIIAARNKGAVNLVGAQPPTSTQPPTNSKKTGAILAALLGCIALFTNLKFGPQDALAGRFDEPDEPPNTAKYAQPSEHELAVRPASVVATKNGHKGHHTIPREQLQADIRRRNITHWLDLIAESRPANLWLTEVRFNGDQISLQAQTRKAHQGHEYVSLLGKSGLKSARLNRIENSEGTTTLIITSAGQPPSPAKGNIERAHDSLGNQSAAIAKQIDDYDITLTRLQHNETDNGASPSQSRLNLGLLGDYAAIRAWLAKLARLDPLLGLENIWLRRASDQQVQVDVELTLFSASESV